MTPWWNWILNFLFSGIGAGLFFWILSIFSSRSAEKRYKEYLESDEFIESLSQGLKTRIAALDDKTATALAQSTSEVLTGVPGLRIVSVKSGNVPGVRLVSVKPPKR